MFSENHKKSGCIEVVCGSMFSGKTEELIRRLRRAQFANQKIAIFKPAIDKVVGVDEAQFFGANLVEVCQTLAERGVRVIVAGLDTDYMGKPFGPMPMLMAVAEDVQKVHAICVKCGNLANHSHRLSKSKDLVVLGEKDIYEPLCRECYNKAMAEEAAKA